MYKNLLVIIIFFGLVFAVQPSYGESTSDLYWEILENTERIIELADRSTMVECESRSYFCYMSNFYAVRKITRAMEHLADELYYETRPAEQVMEDLEELNRLVKFFRGPNGLPIWPLIHLAWEEYIEEKEATP